MRRKVGNPPKEGGEVGREEIHKEEQCVAGRNKLCLGTTGIRNQE